MTTITRLLENSFRGFSSYNAERSRSWKYQDIDLIKRDLLNHFETRVGERVMRPDFGCAIWDWLMEPMNAALREQIINEAIRICHSDSRVEVQNVNVIEFENGIRIEISLLFVGFNVIETFYQDFEQRNTSIT